MAKTRKVNIFDVLRYLTLEKKPWDDISAEEQKLSPYLLNKWLSMNMGIIETVANLQHFTVGNLEYREVYKLYLALIPKMKIYFNYVKGKDSEKYNPELVLVVSQHLECSKRQAIEYLHLISEPQELLIDFLQMYGYTNDQIKKII